MPTRLFLLSVAVVVVVACNGDSSQSTTTVPETSPDTDQTATTAAPPASTQPAPPTTLPPGTEELPQQIRVELAELMEMTQQARQLEFVEQPDVAVVTGEELASRVRDQLEEDLADLPADQALYRLLGLIEEETDLEQLYTDLYSEQVAGFYDGEEGELVVPRAEGGFTALQRATLVHELTHALTDQHYSFHDHYSTLLDEYRYDEASAFQALIEGDAVLAELLYLQNLSPEAQAEFLNESFGVDQEVFGSAPQFIRDALVFPYDSGFLFVERLHRTGGFDAVGEAYVSPPTSSEQIIDPEDYPADEPIPVEVDTIQIEGYELEYQSTWGELSFALMFDQVLTSDTSDTAAGGWGGDSYQVHFDGSEVALVLHYRGDSESDAAELGSALDEYIRAAMDTGEAEEMAEGTAYVGEDAAWWWVDGAEARFVAASDPDLLAGLVESANAAVSDDGG